MQREREHGLHLRRLRIDVLPRLSLRQVRRRAQGGDDVSEHFIKKCICGRVLAQCRCASPDKRVEIVTPCSCGDLALKDPRDAEKDDSFAEVVARADRAEARAARLEAENKRLLSISKGYGDEGVYQAIRDANESTERSEARVVKLEAALDKVGRWVKDGYPPFDLAGHVQAALYGSRQVCAICGMRITNNERYTTYVGSTACFSCAKKELDERIRAAKENGNG